MVEHVSDSGFGGMEGDEMVDLGIPGLLSIVIFGIVQSIQKKLKGVMPPLIL